MFSFTAKCSITMYVMPRVSLVASELVVTMSCVFFLFLSVEVLLDMRASGSELGWLTLPLENGVSIYTSTGIFKTSGSTLETSLNSTTHEKRKRQLLM